MTDPAVTEAQRLGALVAADANGQADQEAPAPGNGSAGHDLLDHVEDYLGRYVAFPSDHARVAVTLWAAHAHVVSAFDSTPRLALLSPEPGSGKTRTLEVLELLTPAAMQLLSASPAAIFRSIDADPRPTLLFDEVDTIFGRGGKNDDNEDLRGLLNAGHRNGATIPRCVGPTHDVRRFPVFAAVALAGLGDLPDTLMSRSVVIRMRRRRPTEKVQPFRYRVDSPAGDALQVRLAAWAETIEDRLVDVWPDMPDGIEDRPADVWEPLLAIADAAEGAWPHRARAACTAMADAAQSREASLGVRLLGDIRAVFGDADKVTTADLLAGLHGIEEAPWADLRGRPLDARGLAWRLGHYEVSSTKIKVKVKGEEKSLQGYRSEHLWDAWARYCPPPTPEEGEPPEPTEPPRSQHPTEVPPVEQVPEPHHQPEPQATPAEQGRSGGSGGSGPATPSDGGPADETSTDDYDDHIGGPRR